MEPTTTARPETGPTPLRNEHRIHVLWPDCDPAGILFYGNYFRWMDDATFFLFEAAGLRKDMMLKTYGVPGMPLVSVHQDFRSPATFGDVLTVESHVSQASGSSFTVSHVFRVEDRVTAEGYEKRVWVKAAADDATQLTAQTIPAAVREALGMPAAQPKKGPQGGVDNPNDGQTVPRLGMCSPRSAICSPHVATGRDGPWGPGPGGEDKGNA